MNDNYDLDRITDRMERARIIMGRQMRASEINADLCNYINETRDPSLTVKILQLAETDPELHKYIKRLEMINNSIYCVKCDTPKYVPGFNEVVAVASTPSAADELKHIDMENTKRKLKTLRSDIQYAIESMSTTYNDIMAYYKNVIGELDSSLAPATPITPAPPDSPVTKKGETLKDIFNRIANSKQTEFDAGDKFNDFPEDSISCDFLTDY